MARIVITGAPASGKSECLEALRDRPAFADFVFFEELARKLIIEKPTLRHNRQDFHREIYTRQVAREDKTGGRSFVTDRGTLDTFAFHPETAADMGTSIQEEYRRYTSVVQLGSAAALGADSYQVDKIRTETIEEALAIEKAIRNVWQGHHQYHFIEAKKHFDQKKSAFFEIMETLVAVSKA